MAIIRQLLIEHPMQLVLPLVIFAATFVSGWIIRRLLLGALRSWTARTESRAGVRLAQALHGPMLVWTVILGIHLAIQGSELPARYTEWTAKVLLVLWIASLTIMRMRLAGVLVDLKRPPLR